MNVSKPNEGQCVHISIRKHHVNGPECRGSLDRHLYTIATIIVAIRGVLFIVSCPCQNKWDDSKRY